VNSFGPAEGGVSGVPVLGLLLPLFGDEAAFSPNMEPVPSAIVEDEARDLASARKNEGTDFARIARVIVRTDRGHNAAMPASWLFLCTLVSVVSSHSTHRDISDGVDVGHVSHSAVKEVSECEALYKCRFTHKFWMVCKLEDLVNHAVSCPTRSGSGRSHIITKSDLKCISAMYIFHQDNVIEHVINTKVVLGGRPPPREGTITSLADAAKNNGRRLISICSMVVRPS
jgi:hypothetical protein